MMRSLYSGVSGMRTHQTKMDVIGNNIANVNTLSYKSSSITFGELMYQTTQRASGPNALTGTGGINAKQIGLGSQSGAINTNIAQAGASQTTGNPFDIKLNGDGFFVVNNGTENYFTRAGAFYVDGGGNLAMTSNGFNVMGWGVDPATGKIKQDTVQPLKVMDSKNMTYDAETTSLAYVSGIIDKNDTDVSSASGKMMNLKFYDSEGYSYTAKLAVKSIGDGSNRKYTVELADVLDSNNESVMNKIPGISFGTNQAVDAIIKANIGVTLTPGGGTPSITFADGTTKNLTTDLYDANAFVEPAITNLAKAFGYTNTQKFLDQPVMDTTVNPATASTIGDMIKAHKFNTLIDTTAGVNQLKFIERNITGAILEFDSKGGFKALAGTTGGTATLNLSNGGVNTQFSNIAIDFSLASTCDNSGSSTITAKNGDVDGKGTGRKVGKMSGISIQQNGMIYATYDNGMNRLLGQIATAEFSNPSGLEKAGDNLYRATLNSGDFDGIGVDVSENGGTMATGTLEMSNVDLSQEFAEMITTQRGFQANSRIITVSDTLLEELVNLKR